MTFPFIYRTSGLKVAIFQIVKAHIQHNSATVWSLQGLDTQEAEEFKQTLAKLSGKNRKRGRPLTSGVLLSGLFVMLKIFDFLNDMNFDFAKITQLQLTLEKFAPYLRE
jgi:hypothetical protein